MNNENEDIIWDEDSDLGTLEVQEDFFVKSESSEDEEDEEDEEDKEDEESEEDEEDEDADLVIKNAYDVFDNLFKYLPSDFKKEYTEEGFEKAKQAVEDEFYNSIHQNYLQNLEKNEKASNYLDFLIKTGGEGDADAWMKINISQNYSETDLSSNIELQKQVITQLYEAQKYDKEDIAQKLEDLEDLDLLEKEAKVALKYVNKSKAEATANLEVEARAKIQYKQETYNNNISALSNTFDSSGIDVKRKQVIISDIMQQLPLKNGGEITMLDYKLSQIKSNPNDIIALANLLHDYEEGKGLNIGKIAARSANTNSIKTLRQKLEDMENSSTVSKSRSGKNKNKKNGLDLSELSLG